MYATMHHLGAFLLRKNRAFRSNSSPLSTAVAGFPLQSLARAPSQRHPCRPLARLGTAALFVVCAAHLCAFEWPSANAVTVSNFGWNDGGSPKLGDTFSASGPITATEDGELILVSNESSSEVSRIPSTLGNWLAIDHGNALVSVYARVENIDYFIPEKIDAGVVIANAGASGWSGKDGFYLSFFDRKERRWVNPSLIINPKEDTRPPQIQGVKLKNDAGTIVDLSQTRILKQGQYGINVHAIDTRLSPAESPLAPFRIISTVNGVETGVLVSETFSARDGALMVYRGTLSLVKQIYAPYPAVESGNVIFNRGQVNLNIIAQDINGNTANVQYRLSVE